jgi:hypothetical protein
LAAVAAASPSTTNLALMNIWAKIPARLVNKKKMPAILALRRGEVSADRPAM